jgi:hypothetical protein
MRLCVETTKKEWMFMVTVGGGAGDQTQVPMYTKRILSTDHHWATLLAQDF